VTLAHFKQNWSLMLVCDICSLSLCLSLTHTHTHTHTHTIVCRVPSFCGKRNLYDVCVLIPGQGVLLILGTSIVTSITALSMSAISTNGVIKGGKKHQASYQITK